MNNRNLVIGGAVLLLASLVIATIATLWGFSSSYASLETAETVGINAVGNGIRTALISTTIGILGSLGGITMIIIGVIRSYPRSTGNTRSTSS